MKFLPYLLLIVSFAIGYMDYPWIFILAVAIVSTLLVMAPRRRQLRSQPQAPDRNMLLDGAFLVSQQTILHFVFFALGIFMARMLAG